jgi:hypothetical protein
VRNPIGNPYNEGDTIYRKRDREDQNKLQFNLTYNLVNSRYEGFVQPSDEDSQGDVIKRGTPSLQTKKKKGSSPISESKQKRKEKHHTIMDENMECVFAMFTENAHKQLTKQADKLAKQLAEIK